MNHWHRRKERHTLQFSGWLTSIHKVGTIELSFDSKGVFVVSESLWHPILWFGNKNNIFFFLWCMLRGKSLNLNKEQPISVHWRSNSFSTSWDTKCVWPSVTWYRTFFVQTPTLPSSMYCKLSKHRRCCMQKQPTLTELSFKYLKNSWFGKEFPAVFNIL